MCASPRSTGTSARRRISRNSSKNLAVIRSLTTDRAPIFQTPDAGTEEKMATGQATEAAKPGWLGNDGNAACRHFFPALKGRVAEDAQLHTALAKPARLG